MKSHRSNLTLFLITNLTSFSVLVIQRSATQFKRRSCYEIGDDVFSLSELECLVIRGKTSRPSHLSLPFVSPPKKSMTYIIYALDATDYRINFLLVSENLVSLSLVHAISLCFIIINLLTQCLFTRTMVIFSTLLVSQCYEHKLWTIKLTSHVKTSS